MSLRAIAKQSPDNEKIATTAERRLAMTQRQGDCFGRNERSLAMTLETG